jgi:CheY-like chemotaxis protein
LQETLTEKDAKSALAAMRQCFQAYQKNSSDISLLNELYSHVYGFSERARVSGYVALHRLSAPFASLVQELYETPQAVNSSVTRTVAQTIDFLTTLMKDRNVAQIKDPATAHIYIVDDDRDNCEAIKLAMEATMLQTTYALEPGEALAEIAVGHFDVIFVDVNLPGMSGFDLCAHIREIPGYATTPIIFLTGLTTLENRVQSNLSGGNDFIGKPFNLHELTVKALTFILKAELHMD